MRNKVRNGRVVVDENVFRDSYRSDEGSMFDNRSTRNENNDEQFEYQNTGEIEDADYRYVSRSNDSSFSESERSEFGGEETITHDEGEGYDVEEERIE